MSEPVETKPEKKEPTKTQIAISWIVLIIVVSSLVSYCSGKSTSKNTNEDIKENPKENIGISTSIESTGMLFVSFANSGKSRILVSGIACQKPGSSERYLISNASAFVPPNGLSEIRIVNPFPEYDSRYGGFDCKPASASYMEN